MHLPAVLTDFLPRIWDWSVYAAIFLVSLIGVIKCLIPLWTTTRTLRRSIRRLQEEAGTVTDHPVWQENLFLGRRLRGCWLRFLQNAIQLDRRGLPCNVEDYVNDDTVTHGPGNAPLAELIPSLLTSLGILGTFIGMTQGLTGLDVTTTDNMMSGIQNLLNGMQFAFGTSVAGVSCSLAFNMLNRIAQGSSYRAIDDFTEAFTQLAMQRPLDNDVQLICQNQDRNHLLGSVNDAITTQLPQSMERAVRTGMQPVGQAMTDFLRGATTSQIEGVSRIVRNFVDTMNASLSSQFVALGKTMSEVNMNQQVSLDRLRESLETTQAMMGSVQQLHHISDDVLRHFETYISELGEARRRDEGFEKTASSLLEEMHLLSQEQTKTIQVIRAGQEDLAASVKMFQQSARDTVKNLTEQGENSASAMQKSGEAVSASSLRLSQSYDSFVQNVVEGVSRSLGMFESSMQGMTEAFAEKVREVPGNGDATALTEIQRTLREIESTLKAQKT